MSSHLTGLRVTVRSIGSVFVALAFAACSSTFSPGIGTATQTYQAPVAPAPIAVAARYFPTPTMTILVLPNFAPGQEAALAALAKTECGLRPFCSVGIWTEDASAPRRLKMSDAEVSARVAQYVHSSKTGLDRTAWNCQMPSYSVGECL